MSLMVEAICKAGILQLTYPLGVEFVVRRRWSVLA
jgi:hypothetical protein